VATAIRATARLGWRARYVGRMGADSGGDMVRTALLEWRDPLLIWPGGEVPEGTVTDARVLLVDGTDPQAAIVAGRAARHAGTRVVLDIDEAAADPEELLGLGDIIICSAGFACGDGTGRKVARLATAYPSAKVVCITLGEEGALAMSDGAELYVPAFRVCVTDTTGAGDVFRAGFIAAWLRSPDGGLLADLLRYANAAAALSCCGVGAQGALPTHAQVQVLLDSTVVGSTK
jgi:sugar/nucleoside kinase (ribokinase family)